MVCDNTGIITLLISESTHKIIWNIFNKPMRSNEMSKKDEKYDLDSYADQMIHENQKMVWQKIT